MITTKQLQHELGITQRAIQNRILRLGLKVEKAGKAFVLTARQADAVRNYKQVEEAKQ
jgi:hypothetical protein